MSKNFWYCLQLRNKKTSKMPNGVCRKRGVRIHKMELHVYLIVFVAKIYLKNAKILLNFVEIFFLNLQSGNNLLPAKNPKLFEMRWGAKLFQIGGGLESLGLNYV